MALVPYTNTTTRHQHVAGKTIKPGETRMVDEQLLPRSPPPAQPETDSPTDSPGDLSLEEIQALSVAKLREHLDGLSADQLTELGMLEAESESPRSTALEAIQEAVDQRLE